MDVGQFDHSLFATAIPTSYAAQKCLQLRHNRQHLIRLSGSSETMIKIGFSAILGRRCFSFGFSRFNDVQIPVIEDQSDQQFTLSLDVTARRLCIRDTSHQGIWTSWARERAFPLANGKSTFVTSSPQDHPHDPGCLSFSIQVRDLMSEAFDGYFIAYAASINRPEESGVCLSSDQRCVGEIEDTHQSEPIILSTFQSFVTQQSNNIDVREGKPGPQSSIATASSSILLASHRMTSWIQRLAPMLHNCT